MLEHGSASSGFTRTDLLVTLVMMLLVVVLLLPMLRGIQQTKNETACQINLRENGLATLAYLQAHDDRFPSLAFTVSAAEQEKLSVAIEAKTPANSGFDRFAPESLICPSDGQPATVPVKTGGRQLNPLRVSYGYNLALTAPGLRLPDVPKPETTAVYFDGTMGSQVAGTYPDALAFARQTVRTRHRGRINLVYADWHTVSVAQIEDVMILFEAAPQPPPD